MSDHVRRLVTGAADHLTLSVLWLASSLPVVSAPAATAALFEVHRIRQRGDQPNVWKHFIAALKENFWRSLTVGVTWAAIGLVLVADFEITSQLTTGKAAFLVALIALSLVYALAFTAIFPVLVSLQAGVWPVVKAAVVTALLFPGRALASLALVAVAGAAVVAMPVAVLVTPSMVAAGLTRLYSSVFERVRDSASPRTQQRPARPGHQFA